MDKGNWVTWCSGALVALLCGCAASHRAGTLPAYNLNGVTYLPLVSICNAANVNLDYDALSRRIELTAGEHKINLKAGENLALVDGKPERLKHRVDFYRGTIVVPYKFKEQIFDSLFKGDSRAHGQELPLLKIKKIVLDPGHGGYDPGAIGKTGLREKNINLDVANRLSRLLKNKGIEIVMTRSTDTFVSLEKRVETANNAGAELFISIHTNANRVRNLSGFEVYYVSPDAGDSARALQSARNASMSLDKTYFAEPLTVDLKATLWDMIFTHSRAESIELARSICNGVNRNLESRVLGVKPAGFFVLKGARMPAVLVEMAFLSNSKEERLLKNSFYRQQMADTIAQGILNYSKECSLVTVSREGRGQNLEYAEVDK